MSEQTRMPGGAYNLPPGCTLAEVNGPAECTHQHPGGADALRQIGYQMDPDGDGTDRALFRCDLCGADQERECKP